MFYCETDQRLWQWWQVWLDALWQVIYSTPVLWNSGLWWHKHHFSSAVTGENNMLSLSHLALASATHLSGTCCYDMPFIHSRSLLHKCNRRIQPGSPGECKNCYLICLLLPHKCSFLCCYNCSLHLALFGTVSKSLGMLFLSEMGKLNRNAFAKPTRQTSFIL